MRVAIALIAVMFGGTILPLRAEAVCHYFRVNYKLLRCAEWKGQDAAEPQAQDVDDLESSDGRAVQVVCSCDYSLKGSDQLCDFDQTIEQSGIRGTQDIRTFCARGRNLCNEICTRTLP